MNGKNRRVRGCFSRGMPNFVPNRKSIVNSVIPKPKPKPKPFYDLPVFNSQLKSNLTTDQLALTYFFETYNYLKFIEEYSYDSNTPFTCINLRQSNFTNGTKSKQ